jgi:molybdate transport system regulatory protein
MLAGVSRASNTSTTAPRLWLKIDCGERGQLGPGKIQLLEGIQAHGSIAAAARAMEMSYRRAWMLVEETNELCGRPVVTTHTGGSARGGAELTEAGTVLIDRYRRILDRASTATRAEMEALTGALRTPRTGGRRRKL